MTDGSDILSVASLPDLVYERLRSEIASGTLQPGRLRISQLSARFGVSAIPIREALRLLEAEGLVSFGGNRSIVINSLQIADVIEIFVIRAELECLAMRLSFPNLADDPGAFEKLDDLVAQMDRQLSAPHEWLTSNAQFHTALYAPARSPRLMNIIETLWVSVEPYLRLYATAGGTLHHAQKEHHQLASLARGGDIETAQRVLREHLTATQEIVVARIAAQDGGQGSD